MNVDIAGIRATALALDDVVGSANELANVRIPFLFGGGARDRATQTAHQLATDAERAVELLGSDPLRAPSAERLRGVIDGVGSLADGGTREFRAAGTDASAAVQSVRSHLLGELDPALDEALELATRESPRTVDPARVADLADLLEARAHLGTTSGRVEPFVTLSDLQGLTAAADGPDRVAYVRVLTPLHLSATGALDDVPALATRARSLLDGGLRQLDRVDAAELETLVTRTPLARSLESSMPELVGAGGAQLVSTIRSIADGSASAADRRLGDGLLSIQRGAATPDGLQAMVLGSLGSPTTPPSGTKLDYVIELLGHPTVASISGTQAARGRSLRQLLVDHRDGYGNPFQLATAIQRFTMQADGTATDPARLREATLDVLRQRTFDAGDLGKLAALVEAGPTSPAGLPILSDIGGTRSFTSLLNDVATGYGDVSDIRLQRYVQGSLLVLDGTMDDVAARAAVGTELFARPGHTYSTTDLARVVAFTDLMPPGSPMAGRHEVHGLRPLANLAIDHASGYGSPGVELERYLETWRLAIDGTTDDAERLRLAALDVLGRDPMSLDAHGWGRVAGMIDSLPDTPEFAGPRELKGLRSLTATAIDLGQGYGTADVRTSRYLDAWMMHLDGTAADPDRIRQAAAEVFARDPAHFTVRDWGMVAALMDLDPKGTIIAAPQRFDGGRTLTATAMDIADGYGGPGGTVYRHFHGMRMAADGTATDPERLLPEVEQLLLRDVRTFTTSDWGKLAAFVDVDRAGHLPLHEGIPGRGRELTAIATDIADGYGNGDELAQVFEEWLPMLDPNYLAKRRAALEGAIAGGPIPHRARLAEFQALDAFGDLTRSQRASIGGRLLEQVTTTTVPGARTFLDDVDAVLKDMDGAPKELSRVRETIDELVARNRSRIKGSTPRGAVRGYSNHPDYAELGRIRANLGFLARATTPRQAAPTTIPEPPASAAAGTPGGLTW